MSDAKAANLDFWVREPFLPNEYADIIIRSSDGHTFHVVKAILSLCSSVFKDMFSLPRPAATGDSLQTVDISESGAVTDILLRHIYPIEPPAIIGASLWSDVVSAARKYEMNRVVDAGKRAIRNLCSDVPPSALQAFVLSCTHHLEYEARLAAFGSLRSRLQDPSLVHTLYSLPGRAVVCLFMYHGKVGNEIADLISTIDDQDWFMMSTDPITCGSCIYSDDVWWGDVSRSIVNAVYTEGPLSAAAFSRETFEGLDFRCDDCKTVLLQSHTFKEFVRTMRTRIESVASKVEFEIPWET